MLAKTVFLRQSPIYKQTIYFREFTSNKNKHFLQKTSIKMGCDGGTIPRRDELVRVAKKPEQKDKESELAYRWRHCAITQQPLQQPIVMCGLGRLYSKQNVIENLLEKDKMPDSAKHIQSLKDVKNLVLTSNPNYKDCNKSGGMLDTRSAPFICKLIGLEMTGKFKFVALWTCGCVFSERALKEVKSNICSLCQTPFKDEDVIVLNGDDAAVEQMLVKMQIRSAKLKAEKRDKKAAKKKNAATETTTAASDNTDESAEKPETKMIKTEKLFTDPEAGSSKSNIGKQFKLKRERDTEALVDPAMKKLKDGNFNVASDPKASEVYKSLFTSHKSEQEQTRAHWVTYNPFYN